MDGSMFRDLWKGVAIFVVIVAVCSFGIGYGCSALKWRPHLEWRKS